MSGTLTGIGFAVLAAVALAVQSLVVKVGTSHRPVSQVILTVSAINVVALVPLTVLWYYPQFGLTPLSVASFAVGGLLGSLLARAALFVGIHRLGASRAEPLKSTFPLVAVALAVLVLDEPLTLALLAGVVLLVGGAAGVSWDVRDHPAITGDRRWWLTLAFPLAAAFLLGIDPVFTAFGLAEGTPALVGVTVRVLAAAVGVGLYFAWRRVRTGPIDLRSPTKWSVLAGVANTTYLAAYLAALARAPVSVVTPILGASPLLVVLGSALLLGREERVTARLALAVLVLVAGVVLIVRG